MDYLDYREQLGIGFDDEKKKRHFFTLIYNRLNLLENLPDFGISVDEYMAYCDRAGVRGEFYLDNSHMLFHSVVNSLESSEQTIQEFVFKYVAFMNSLHKSYGDAIGREKFEGYIKECFERSHINIEIMEDDDGHFIFPQGAKELDNGLVSQSLIWLRDYPNTYKIFSQALHKYAEKKDSYSNIADEFRKALETFLQELFNNVKSVENNMSEYGAFMDEHNVPSEISNVLTKILDLYTKYNNNYAKHHDKAEENVLEYIMYQTGSFIRLLITLKNEG